VDRLDKLLDRNSHEFLEPPAIEIDTGDRREIDPVLYGEHGSSTSCATHSSSQTVNIQRAREREHTRTGNRSTDPCSLFTETTKHSPSPNTGARAKNALQVTRTSYMNSHKLLDRSSHKLLESPALEIDPGEYRGIDSMLFG